MFSGTLPLAELRQEKKPTVLILQGEVKVNEAGPVEFNVESSEKYQIWIDDQPAESKAQISATLQPGVHKITLRVEVSEKEAPTLKIDLRKPETSSAQFEVVGGA